MTILKVILAILLPPLAAFLEVGLTSQFWINLLVTVLLVYIGGIIHALWLVLSHQGETRPVHA